MLIKPRSRGVLALLLCSAVLGCGAPTATAPSSVSPAGSDAPGPPTAAGSGPIDTSAPADAPTPPGPSYPPDDPRSISDDLFTAEAEPLELTTTIDEDSASTADIGPAGGEVSTTGPDGTIYTL